MLAEGLNEEAVAYRTAKANVSRTVLRGRSPAGLILGYAALDEAGIAEGIRRLRLAIDAELGVRSR